MSRKRTRLSKTTPENPIVIDEERVHELNQGEQEEPTEPEIEESTNKTETEVDSVIETEEEESDKELNSPQPAKGAGNPEPRVEPEEEPVKLSVEPKFTTPMPTPVQSRVVGLFDGIKDSGANANMDVIASEGMRGEWAEEKGEREPKDEGFEGFGFNEEEGQGEDNGQD
ncbi:uncharacterized protein [Gossypium hirsutum]|uniref:Uncharacterized protein n=1 Tax=Gossypium hirsutum TaxID=3635 RepID=A0ABM2ZNJ3_GOSHI|nr:uncharacterized protein LOC121214526 [Gossypium hirsutum]